MNIENKLLNEVIEELPIEFIRQSKISYDAKFISIIFKNALKDILNNKRIILNQLKYDNYEMKDIYYLISKVIDLMKDNYDIKFYPNYKKDGYNIFIHPNIMYVLFKDVDDLILEYF